MIKVPTLLDNEIVFNDKITRLAYSRDASMYRLMPESVVRPRNINDVKDLLTHSRTTGTPITFRTGGTSLSGQSIGTGIIAEVLYDWQRFKILDNGLSTKMQPGVNGGFINKILEPFHRRIGPDPASINSARIGGIVSNNSSGMVCGTEFNSYHTLKDISFILPNGNMYSTERPNENQKFCMNEPELANGLKNIRKEIINNDILFNKIRNKYRIKNTIGYSMNALIDHERPLDIFSHLLVGAEGTLAFISDVTLNTIPDPPNKGTGLVLFDTPESAASSVTFFKDLGASAIEFLDDQSLRTAKHFDEPPYDPKMVHNDHTGLLVEFQNNSKDEIKRLINSSKDFSNKNRSVVSFRLVTAEDDRETIWKIRKGLYPTLGSLRKTGTSIITEDIAVSASDLAPAIRELKNIFHNCKFDDGVIFGHAKDGNLHFITSVDLDDKAGIGNYERMMIELSNMTLQDFNGSLKAEHGTGRNMASFVEAEWGGEIYKLMWKIKELVDPKNIMNPNVLLTRDERLHMRDLKPMPKVHSEVDACIECGFCEKICPSRGLSLTPRQRIGVMRELTNMKLSDHEKAIFKYSVDHTCATDGLCSMECPVNINTGVMVKSLRFKGDDPWYICLSSQYFGLFLIIIRNMIKLVRLIGNIIGDQLLRKITKAINRTSKGLIPIWPRNGLMVSNRKKHKKQYNVDYLHYESCVNRVLAGDGSGMSSSEMLKNIATSVDIDLVTFDSLNDNCCGMAYNSRGYKNTGETLRNKLLDEFLRLSNNGDIPIIVDMSPCTQFILEKDQYKDLKIIDSVSFLNDIISQLDIKPLEEPIFIHNVCSLNKMGNKNELLDLVDQCADHVEKPIETFCCGTGGDRGLRYPELTNNSILRSVGGITSKKGVSSSRTCELGLEEVLQVEFSSIEALVYNRIKK